MKIVVCLFLLCFFTCSGVFSQRKLSPESKKRQKTEKHIKREERRKPDATRSLMWNVRRNTRRNLMPVSPWHNGTAGILPSQQAEVSLFTPTRIGFSKKTEWLFRIAEEPFLPNIGLKHQWWGNRRLKWSTVHTLYYPYPLLKILHSTGFKGLVPDSVTIGQGIAMRNELLFSWLMNPWIEGCSGGSAEKVMTLCIGTEFYAGEKDHGVQPFDYIHSLYHTQLLDDKFLYYAGLQMDSYFSYRFRYSLNGLFYTVDFTDNYAVEANLRLTYRLSPHIGISAVGKGAYIHVGEQTKFTGFPLLDLTYYIRPSVRVIRGDIFKNRRRR